MNQRTLSSLMALTLLGVAEQTFAQGTAFTYNGRLNEGGNPANGIYDIRAGLFDTNSGGTVVAGPVTNSAIAVSNGLFSITLDYGNVFNGTNYWLEVAVRSNNVAGFTILVPRQELTPTPYAIFAEGANAAGLSGTIPSASLAGAYSGAVNLTNPVNSFAGNGAGLSGVNAAALGGLASSNFWQLAGNTTTAGQFLGTLNNQPLDLHADGVRALRLILRTDATGQYSNAPNVIAGSSVNLVKAGVVGGTVGGGGGNDTNAVSYPNQVNANFGAISGGANNDVTSLGVFSYIGGGQGNVANQGYAVLGGGLQNTASNAFTVVGGGFQNSAGGPGATVGGGALNASVFVYTTIGGGVNNTASGTSAGYSTVAGGDANSASGDYSTIGGGTSNTNSGNASTLSGGYFNTVSGDYAVVAGGDANTASGSHAAVVGGYQNLATGAGAFIGGGGYDGVSFLANVVHGGAATIGGGEGNLISSGGTYAVIGGGYVNAAKGNYATVGGGEGNVVSAGSLSGTVAGGYNNVASGLQGSTVGGGENNVASGWDAAVVGGNANTASGQGATAAGGYGNTAGGLNSFAAGEGAYATHDRSFVWADAESILGFHSDRPNQFKIQAAGGVYMSVSGSSGLRPAALEVNSTSTNGVAIFADCSTGSSDSTFVTVNTGTGDLIRGFSGPSGGALVFKVQNDGTVVSKGVILTSDRNAKEHFASISPSQILAKVAELPISEWNYKAEAGVRHLGPMAQDFQAAFGLNGLDDKHISVVDEGGVALAAIQGLNQKLEERARTFESRLQQKDSEIQQLQQTVNQLKNIVNQLAAKKEGL